MEFALHHNTPVKSDFRNAPAESVSQYGTSGSDHKVSPAKNSEPSTG